MIFNEKNSYTISNTFSGHTGRIRILLSRPVNDYEGEFHEEIIGVLIRPINDDKTFYHPSGKVETMKITTDWLVVPSKYMIDFQNSKDEEDKKKFLIKIPFDRILKVEHYNQ